MNWLYRNLLELYPPEYRSLFADEMLQVHLNAAQEHQGLLSRCKFQFLELFALLTGASSEWHSKWQSPCDYLATEQSADLETRRKRALQKMQFAIAHHDFPAARRYSQEEQLLGSELSHGT